MADIRVERKGGSKVWLWVLLAIVVLIVALFLLDWAGYIDLPIDLGAAASLDTPFHRVALSVAGSLQEG